jgi:hypothetical protein
MMPYHKATDYNNKIQQCSLYVDPAEAPITETDTTAPGKGEWTQ